MNSYDIDYDFIFGIPYRVIDVENHVDDNHIPEVSKHSDDSSVTREEDDTHSILTSRVTVERVPVLTNDQVDGEHLSLILHDENQDLTVKGEHMRTTSQVEGELVLDHVDIEGEHQNSNPLVEGEPSGSNPSNINDQSNEFHDVIDNILNAGEGSEAEDVFEDAPLDIDLAYPPLDKWTCNHPKEQVLGDSHVGVLIRA